MSAAAVTQRRDVTGSLVRIVAHLDVDDALRVVQYATRLRALRDLEALHLDRPFDLKVSLQLDRLQAVLEAPP